MSMSADHPMYAPFNPMITASESFVSLHEVTQLQQLQELERLQLELQCVQLLMIEAQSQALQSQMPLVNERTSFVPPPQATGSADKASRAKGASTAGVWVGLGGSKSQSQGPRTFRSNQKSSKRV